MLALPQTGHFRKQPDKHRDDHEHGANIDRQQHRPRHQQRDHCQSARILEDRPHDLHIERIGEGQMPHPLDRRRQPAQSARLGCRRLHKLRARDQLARIRLEIGINPRDLLAHRQPAAHKTNRHKKQRRPDAQQQQHHHRRNHQCHENLNRDEQDRREDQIGLIKRPTQPDRLGQTRRNQITAPPLPEKPVSRRKISFEQRLLPMCDIICLQPGRIISLHQKHRRPDQDQKDRQRRNAESSGWHSKICEHGINHACHAIGRHFPARHTGQ